MCWGKWTCLVSKKKKKIYPEITSQPLYSGSREELQGNFSFEAAPSWNIHTDVQDNGHFDYVELCLLGLQSQSGTDKTCQNLKVFFKKISKTCQPSLS